MALIRIKNVLSDLNFFSLLKRLPLTRVIICGILILVAGAIFQRCDHKRLKEITSEKLRPGEKEAIIIGTDSRSVVAITHGTSNGSKVRTPLLRRWHVKPEENSGTVVERIDGARGIRISIGDSGNVSIIARTRGFCFEPGLGFYATDSHSRVFVDVQLLFARRYGVNAGLGFGLRGKLEGTAFVAGSYNVWSNTSVLVGYDTKNEVLLGMRIKF